jgi:cytosine/adenosine deaminase-related metal-dependent hydrolase
MKLLLRHLHWYSEGADGEADIRLADGRIAEMGKGLAVRRGERVIVLSGFLALPGLINAHDHLEWNLLPLPGRPPYPNFSAYAADVYRPHELPIRELLAVDFRDRLLWGAYKNLISGVTTVCHHNPYDAFFEHNFPVRVVRGVGWSHSLRFSTNVVGDFQRAAGRPFIIHAAEGVDETARAEINTLWRLGILQNNTVIVHGITLQENEIAMLEKVGAALIWCPTSNLRLYGQTVPIAQLRGRVRVSLGTDSALTGAPTLFDELRVALATEFVTPEELLAMVTTAAAEILKLPAGAGTLRIGATADLMILPDTAETPARTLLQSTPATLQLVMIGGEIHLAEPDILGLRANASVEGKPKFLKGNLAKLQCRILRSFNGCGTEITTTPLWQKLRTSKASQSKNRL